MSKNRKKNNRKNVLTKSKAQKLAYKKNRDNMNNLNVDIVKENLVSDDDIINTEIKHEDLTILPFNKKAIFILLFIVFPIIFITLLYMCIKPKLVNSMILVTINGMKVMNSEDVVNKIISPFFSSIVLLVLFFLTCLIINRLSNKFFENKLYNVFAKKTLRFAETGILVLGLISMFYLNAENFLYTDSNDYKNYVSHVGTHYKFITTLYDEDGVELANTDEPSKIGQPSVESTGVNSPDAPFYYRMILMMSQFLKLFSKYFSILITVSGAIIFPLKRYIKKE